MTRYVLDTNQIIAAGTGWLKYGAPVPDNVCSRRLLIHVARNETGLHCPAIMQEYVEKLVTLNHPAERIGEMVKYLLGAFEQVHVVTQNAPHPPSDPDDEIFLLCAMDGNADYLISDDAALLDVSAHYPSFVICQPHVETVRLGI